MKEHLTLQEEDELTKMTSIEREAGFLEAMRQYEQIPIPEELDGMVRRTIQEQTALHERKMKKAARKRGLIITARTFGTLAAALLLFVIPLNTNEAFARQMQRIPVIGKLAEVLTVRSYSYSENDMNVRVNVPEIVEATGQTEDKDEETLLSAYAEPDSFSSGGAGAAESRMSMEGRNGAEPADSAEDLTDSQSLDEDLTDGYAKEFAEEVNAQIGAIIDSYEADAKARFAEYKESFFATGGTEEEWGGRTCEINVDYQVTYNEGNTLSLVLTTSEAWCAVYGTRYYYNLDLQNGSYLTLADILGEDWAAICNESIVNQIETRLAEDTEDMLLYWNYGSDENDEFAEGFTTVDEATDFYINAEGNPVVCFDKYEIAPGYMGIQEFEIQR